jgi:L-fuculose-phosphate aldolase
MKKKQNEIKSSSYFKRETAYFMRRLYNYGLTTTSGGNISTISEEGFIFITASGTDKGRMKVSDIIVMDIAGEIIEGNLPVTIENRMHLAIYKRRKDVKAIVHAHPITASAFAASSVPIRTDLISESVAVIGKIGYAEYHLMGTEILAETVAKAAEKSDCIIMRNHGVITLGKNLLQAFDRMEIMEAAARMTLIHNSHLKGSTLALSQKELSAIDKLMGRSDK